MPIDLKSTIQAAALPKLMADGSLQPALTVAQIEELAIRFGTDGKTIEIAALENGVVPERYARNFNTFDPVDQIRLLNGSATVVGLGGLGGTVIECLARAGVGHLNLVDSDRFEDHNLNRQLLCTQDQVGQTKARSAAERICRINSSISVQAHQEFLTPKNAGRLISSSDVVVDCLDNIETRFVLEASTKEAGIPMVSAALAGLSGHVTTIFPQDDGLALIYGPLEDLQQSKGAETVLGCLPQAVVLVGAVESAEAVKVILGQEKAALRNRMLVVDVAVNTYEVIRLA